MPLSDKAAFLPVSIAFEHWLRELLWDYAEVGSAVAAGIDRGSLAGRVVQGPQGPTAYCYFVVDGGRTVVGSLFATAACRGRGHEEMVLEEVLGEALGGGSSSRVECQTLFSTAPGAGALFARAGFSSRDRHYLVRDLGAEAPGREPGVSLRPIRREDLPRAEEIVFRSHEGSLDAALNTTYATRAHCRGFLDTLVLRGGCGQFEPLASSKNAFRHKLRTAPTVIGIVVAIAAFGLLRTIVDAWYAGANASSSARLITRSSVSLVFALPLTYAQKIRQVPGVESVSWANWFGGIYISERNFFPQFAIDAPTYLDMYPEFILSPEERKAFLTDRMGAIVGASSPSNTAGRSATRSP